MVNFERFKLSNGLTLLVNEDKSTPLVALNILYNVGSRDEHPDRTGFAHLFEHLMFGGSKNIPLFDEPLQNVGGENNAFTSSDITNYYITVPADNLETALWLESDRMLELDFSEQSLNVQKNVVVEEFRQRYLNQPYGDIWLQLRPLAYQAHPYQWPTIGRNEEHIRNATLANVKDFFYAHYAPNNAFVALSGNISSDEAYRVVNKWFGGIEKRAIKPRNLPKEPRQTEARQLTVQRNVPFDAIYKAYHMPARDKKGFYVCDLMTDLLSSGRSARLYQQLIKEQGLFSDINAYITGDADPGLLLVGGKLIKDVSVEKANLAIEDILNELSNNLVDYTELKKVQNRFETNILMGETSILNKAMNLSFYEMLGDASHMNKESEKYCSIIPEDIRCTAKDIFSPDNCSTLFYLSQNK
jgi:predicted Zn-dependent peptidase